MSKSRHPGVVFPWVRRAEVKRLPGVGRAAGRREGQRQPCWRAGGECDGLAVRGDGQRGAGAELIDGGGWVQLDAGAVAADREREGDPLSACREARREREFPAGVAQTVQPGDERMSRY